MPTQHMPSKRKIDVDYDDTDDEDFDEPMQDDDEDDIPVRPKMIQKTIQPPKGFREPEQPREETKREQKKEKVAEPQYIQVPRVISQEEMLNLIYEQNLQILNLLTKKDE